MIFIFFIPSQKKDKAREHGALLELSGSKPNFSDGHCPGTALLVPPVSAKAIICTIGRMSADI